LAGGIGLVSVAAQAPASSVGRSISIDGNAVYYEERGRGLPVVLTPGGQNRVETVRPLAEQLAANYRVISWERANIGRADVVFKGARDLDLWTDQLAELLLRLDAFPAYLVGASSGSRISYVMALRYPDRVRGLFLFLVTGGGTIGESLGRNYYGDYADLAEQEGMQAVAQTPFWADRIAMNPANLQRLLAIEPREFARVMRRWQAAMRSSDVMIGVTDDDLRQLNANGTPVAIVQGCEGEESHRRDRSERFAALVPNAQLIPTPPQYCEEYAAGLGELKVRPEAPKAGPFRGYEMLSMVPGLVRDFIARTEAQPPQSGRPR
jgi:pimeloyl-ACP methyl ester carboxylesterase